jgi:NAD(P)-dependent dehydrogenase (short-subunit alcohol dehydrogenase family)
MTSLEGQRALITGSQRGLGWAIAETYAKAGAKVMIQDLDGKGADGAAGKLRRANLTAASIGGSVTSVEDIAAMFRKMDELWGGIDILVNNAGVSQNKPTVEMTAADWDRIMDVNLRGVFLCAVEAGRRMVAQKSGLIVNISSIWGIVAGPARIGYCVSKAGVSQMTKALATEWARDGVRVNAIAPGYTESKMLRDVFNSGKVDESAILRRTPMGRLAEPQEMADMALFLASPQAKYITGQIMAVDGGWTAYGYT